MATRDEVPVAVERVVHDALRRPDGENISKSMRQCIDELYEGKLK